jgi:hypothetical protein
MGGISLQNEGNPLGLTFVSYVKGIPHQLKCVKNDYNIITGFKINHTV